VTKLRGASYPPPRAMIGPKESIPAARWAEKLRAPAALCAAEGYLYRPPPRLGATATLAWIFDPVPDAALRRALAHAAADGAGSLTAGGPPGNYLVSGVDEAQLPWFAARGFAVSARHCDLVVDAREARRDPRVTPAAGGDALGWIDQTFGPHWRAEATRGAARAGLRVTRDAEGLTGFVVIGGNNADAGTFGPIGVAPRARGRGLGEALAQTALHALAAEGFAEVTVPWVDADTVRFYERVARVRRVASRARMVARLTPDEPSAG
jgi:ribosomal protein S18 acetylase RimI-like enzyme